MLYDQNLKHQTADLFQIYIETIFGFWNPDSIFIRQKIMSEFSLFCNSTI